MLSPCLLPLELPGEFDEDTVTGLVGVLGFEVGDLVLCSYKVDGGLTLLHLFLHKKVPQRDVLRARAACAVTGDVKCRCVVDVKWHAAKPLLEA